MSMNIGWRAPCALLFSALLGAPLGGPAFAHVHDPSPNAAATPGFELPKPKALPAFELFDHRGNSFDRRRFEGRWTLVLFGYTSCPDICPTTLAALAELQRQWARLDASPPADVALVSIDPKRDTQARLAAYVAQFGPNITGLRGSAAQVERLAEPLRVRHSQAHDMTIDHTGSVSLIGPDARLYAVYTLPLQPARAAADVLRIRKLRCGADAAATHGAPCAQASAR